MANVQSIVEHLMNEYDNSIGARQISLADAIEVTDQLLEALNDRLLALHNDEEKQADAPAEEA